MIIVRVLLGLGIEFAHSNVEDIRNESIVIKCFSRSSSVDEASGFSQDGQT